MPQGPNYSALGDSKTRTLFRFAATTQTSIRSVNELVST